MNAPLLSIVIAVLNREQLIKRAVASALADDGDDFEVIVVDDGSTDGTSASVRSFTDRRVRLLTLTENTGQCPARNRGAEIANGQWLVFLDSDDELAPGGLELIRRRIQRESPDVAKILFSCVDDHGAVSPRPAPAGEVFDYEQYLRWQEATRFGATESLPCPRTAAFLACPYPERRIAFEGVHELDFARRWKIRICPDVVRLYHYDAPNRLMKPSASDVMKKAEAMALQAEEMLSRHGSEMRTLAPTRWINMTREAALYSLLAGNRTGGIRHSLKALRRTPAHAAVWIVLVAGVINRQLLGRLWSRKRAAA